MFGEHCEILQTAHMANFKENVEEMVGQLKKRRRWPAGAATTGGEMVVRAGDEMAETGGVMSTDEG